MEWLLTHMWMALVGVGLFGIMLGWAVRGIMVMGKFHRAVGAKEIANAELAEARNELDVLLKAQRGEIPVQPHPVAAGGADHVLKKELKDREKRLADLSDELAKSKGELEELKTSKSRSATVAAVGGAVAGVGAAAMAGKDDEESPSLAWRNRHLEARLKELEGQVETLNIAELAPAEPVAPAVVAAPVAGAFSAEEKVAADKAAWRVTYLNQRIDALEEEVLAAPVAVAAIAEPVSDVAVIGAAAPEAEAEAGAADEELARLRWRNRYLEGRLAYFDGESKQEDDGDEDEGTAGLLVGAGAAAAAVAAAVVSRDEHEAEAEVEADIVDVVDETSVEAVAEAVEAISVEAMVEEEGGSVSDAILKSLTQADEAADAEDAAPEIDLADVEPTEAEVLEAEDAIIVTGGGADFVKPLALDSPVGGQPDDLTVIGGVGPKIQEVLNGLGVYHYDQIAAWTPENIAWIDDHLSFSGRIDREGWVEQALILAGDD